MRELYALRAERPWQVPAGAGLRRLAWLDGGNFLARYDADGKPVIAWTNPVTSKVPEPLLSSESTPLFNARDGSTAWLEQRREQVATGPVPDSVVEGMRVEPDGADKRVVKFVQKFGTNSLRKELTLVREGASWRIVAEKVAEVK